MFAGKMEDYESGPVDATLKNITIQEAAYNAKIGEAIFVVGNATFDLKDSTISDNQAGSAKLLFNGGGAVYLNSHGLKAEEGRAILNATNCTFTGNTTANGGGGALMAFTVDINLTDSKLTGNKAISEMGVAEPSRCEAKAT